MNQSRHKKAAAVLALLCALLGPAVRAQSEKESSATLQETLDWIGGKLTDRYSVLGITSDSSGNRMNNFKPESFNQCQLIWTIDMKVKDKSPFTLRQELDLSKMNANGVKVERVGDEDSGTLFVTLEAFNGQATGAFMALDRPKFKAPTTNFGFNLGAYPDSNDYAFAERLARALRHAIKLCGGKSEPF